MSARSVCSGHPAFAVPLGAAHLGATEATRALDPDAEGAGLLSVLHGTLHRPPEGDAVGELVGDTLGDQRGVELRRLDLHDVELDLVVAGDLGEPGAELVGLGAPTTDHDARAGGVDVDAELVTGALDLDAADRRIGQQTHDVVADLPVLGEVLLVVAIAEPAALPLGGDTEAEAVGVDFLAHQASSSVVSVLSSSRWDSALLEAGGLGGLFGGEPHLGDGLLVVARAGHVVEHRVGVALDVEAVGGRAVLERGGRAFAVRGGVRLGRRRCRRATPCRRSPRRGRSGRDLVGRGGVGRLRPRRPWPRRGGGPGPLDAGPTGCRGARRGAPAGDGRAASLARARRRIISSVKRVDDDRDVAGALADAAARPRARGRNRLRVGPSSAKQARTYRSSGSSSSLWTALATAEASTLRMSWAMSRSVNCSNSSAERTSRPRMRLSTSRAL